jgi:hypothetical protein
MLPRDGERFRRDLFSFLFTRRFRPTPTRVDRKKKYISRKKLTSPPFAFAQTRARRIRRRAINDLFALFL